jgi:hypothetical protein
MARLETLEYTAEFLRGWPVAEPTAEMNYPSDTPFGNGDLVAMLADAKVGDPLVVGTDAAPELLNGVVVRGLNDRGIAGVANPADPSVPNIVSFGNTVVRLAAEKVSSAMAPVIGSEIVLVQITEGSVVADHATVALIGGFEAQPSHGTLLETDAAGNAVIRLK